VFIVIFENFSAKAVFGCLLCFLHHWREKLHLVAVMVLFARFWCQMCHHVTSAYCKIAAYHVPCFFPDGANRDRVHKTFCNWHLKTKVTLRMGGWLLTFFQILNIWTTKWLPDKDYVSTRQSGNH